MSRRRLQTLGPQGKEYTDKLGRESGKSYPANYRWEELLKSRVTQLNTQVLLINSLGQSKMKYFQQSHCIPWD